VTDDELRGLFDAMREDIGAIRADNAAMHANIGAIQANIAMMQSNIATMQSDNSGIHADIGAMQTDIGAIRADSAAMREENAAARAEMRRHFDVVTEATHSKIQVVAESVLMVNEKLDRKAAELHEKIDSAVSETRALIKWTYDRFDQRVSALEAK
jgi:septal ring factor EnvC (AmiA/AmiB activator)